MKKNLSTETRQFEYNMPEMQLDYACSIMVFSQIVKCLAS